jgi:hypothetical protein
MGHPKHGCLYDETLFSPSTRLPVSLLERQILFDHRIPRFQESPRNCRSLGFARDDKKERAAVQRGWLPTEGFFKSNLDNSEVRPSPWDFFRLTRFVGQDARLQAADDCFRDQAFDGAA